VIILDKKFTDNYVQRGSLTRNEVTWFRLLFTFSENHCFLTLDKSDRIRARRNRKYSIVSKIGKDY
jgi:hypothetical protein